MYLLNIGKQMLHLYVLTLNKCSITITICLFTKNVIIIFLINIKNYVFLGFSNFK